MKAKTAALCGILTALAFALSWAESFIPLPMPGLKLGLANIITLFVLDKLGLKNALLVLSGRCLLTFLLFGSPVTLLFSFSGGILAVLTMKILSTRHNISVYGISTGGAAAHNIGQCTAAVFLMQTPQLYMYLLFLLPAGIITGMLVGFIYDKIRNRL